MLLFASCKKSSTTAPESSISAAVDGVNQTFNVNATAKQTSDETMGNTLMISGAETSENGSGSINIEVNSVSAITTGTYSLKTGTPQGFDPITSISYVEGYLVFYPTTSPNSSNSITITYISSTNVQGTFNPALSRIITSTPPAVVVVNKTITNGKFNVQIK